MRQQLKEFREFVSRGSVLDLAVAVVIGAAFTAVINAVVQNLITPLVGMIASKDFSDLSFTINGSTFGYGFVINAALQFLFVSAAVFFLVVKPINALSARARRGEVPAEEVPVTAEQLLTEIRDLLAAQAP